MVAGANSAPRTPMSARRDSSAPGGFAVVVGDLAEGDEPFGVVLLPFGDVVVIGSVGSGEGFLVVEAAVGGEDAVDDLGVDAVTLLVGPSEGVV